MQQAGLHLSSEAAAHRTRHSLLSPKQQQQPPLTVFEDEPSSQHQQDNTFSSKTPSKQRVRARQPLGKRDINLSPMTPELAKLSKPWQNVKHVDDTMLDSVAAERSLADAISRADAAQPATPTAEEEHAEVAKRANQCPPTAQKTVTWDVDELSHRTPSHRLPLDLSKFTPLPVPVGDMSGFTSDNDSGNEDQYSRFATRSSPAAQLNDADGLTTRVDRQRVWSDELDFNSNRRGSSPDEALAAYVRSPQQEAEPEEEEEADAEAAPWGHMCSETSKLREDAEEEDDSLTESPLRHFGSWRKQNEVPTVSSTAAQAQQPTMPASEAAAREQKKEQQAPKEEEEGEVDWESLLRKYEEAETHERTSGLVLRELTPTTIRRRSARLESTTPYEVEETVVEDEEGNAFAAVADEESELGQSDKENMAPEEEDQEEEEEEEEYRDENAPASPVRNNALSSPMLRGRTWSPAVLREREVHHAVDFSDSDADSDEGDAAETVSQSFATALSFESSLNPMSRATAPPLTFQRRRRRRTTTEKEIVIHGTVGCTTAVTMSFKNNRHLSFRVLACVTAAAEDEHCFTVDVPQLLLKPGTEGTLEIGFTPDREGEFRGTLVLCKDNQVFQFRLRADAVPPVQYNEPPSPVVERVVEQEVEQEVEEEVEEEVAERHGERHDEQREVPDVRNDTARSDATSHSSSNNGSIGSSGNSSPFSDVSLELRHEWLKQWVEQRKHQMSGTRDTTSQFSVPLSITLQPMGRTRDGHTRFAADILLRNFAAEELELHCITSSSLIRVPANLQPLGPHDDFRLRVWYDDEQAQRAHDPIIGYVGVRTRFGSKSVEVRMPLSQPSERESPAAERTAQRKDAPREVETAEGEHVAAIAPAPPVQSAKGDRSVYFRRRLLDFGHIQAGSLVEKKVDLCNRLYEPVVVYLSDPKLPFILTHNEIHIRPRSYVRVPVRFLPVERKEFNLNLMAQTSDGKSLFWIELKGTAH